MTIVLKKIPEDFRVQETQAIHKRIGSDTGPIEGHLAGDRGRANGEVGPLAHRDVG